MPSAALLASLLAFRVVYYLIPFAVGAILLVGYEVGQRRERLAQTAGALARLASAAVPRVLAAATFVAGVVLLISGATPGVGSRLHLLDRVLPLAVIEVSHSWDRDRPGVTLLAMGLRRRLDVAYHLTVMLLGAAGLLAAQGSRYEEAIALTWCWRCCCRPVPTSIAAPRLRASAQNGLDRGGGPGVAHDHLAGCSPSSTWNFPDDVVAVRPARRRAAVPARQVGVLAMLVSSAGGSLLAARHAPPARRGGDGASPAIVAAAPVAASHLALMGDKALLISPDGRGFVMYALSRRSWVAMGDPVGPEDVQEDLAWRFRELVDKHGGYAVFYQVSAKPLPLYIDLGLTPLKLGEEAGVPLAGFSLDGPDRRGLRRTQRQVEKAACAFSLVMPEGVADLLPELQRVSDAWLTTKNTREKGFSLGRFDANYVRRLPVALVRREQELVAFATLWPSGDRAELSADLIRYGPEAPAGVMEYLLVELMLWGRAQGYHRFNLGMAPLSGLANRSFAPLWNRLNALVFRHGEHFYQFQGLRLYKAKFRPEWVPKYLASPGGLAVPRILADVTAWISGGLRGAVRQ